MLPNQIESFSLFSLFILSHAFQAGEGHHSPTIIAMQMLLLFNFGQSPPKHLENESDLEILKINIIELEHLLVEKEFLTDECSQSRPVYDWIAAVGLAKIHLVYYLLHA
jgi:hypothetical protein